MADKKISDLTAAAAPSGSELLAAVQSGVTKKLTINQILAMSRTVTAITSAAGVLTIDCSLGDYFTVTLSENITSIIFTNLPGAGLASAKVIQITQATGPYTVTWPASFKWSNGVVGVVSTTSADYDLLSITTLDNGTSWLATLAKDFS